jgi:hypothetical protein
VSIVMRQDSKKNTYQLWAQDQPASCAIASIWMARSQAKQKSFAETEWELAWRIYQHTVVGIPLAFSSNDAPPPMSINPSGLASNQSTFNNMFGNFGTFAAQVVHALRTDGLRVTHTPNPGPPGITVNSAKLSQTTPAIAMLGWYSLQPNGQWQRNGGHFIVAADVIANQVVFLDPWGGVLNEVANNGRYQATGWIEETIYLSA